MNQDLQVQLDQALQQALDPNSKGNSLFAEVHKNIPLIALAFHLIKAYLNMLDFVGGGSKGSNGTSAYQHESQESVTEEAKCI